MLEGIELSWSNVALVVGISQFFIVAPTLYLASVTPTLSKHLFVILLGSFSVIFLEILIYSSPSLFARFPNFVAYLNPAKFLSPVLLYLFVKSHLSSTFRLQLKHYWHLLPVLILSSPSIYYLSLPLDEKMALYSFLEGYDSGSEWEDYIVPVQLICYLIPSIWAGVKKNMTIQDEYSFKERVSVLWLIYILAILGCLATLHMVTLTSEMIGEVQYVITYVAIIYLLGLMALRHNLYLAKIDRSEAISAVTVNADVDKEAIEGVNKVEAFTEQATLAVDEVVKPANKDRGKRYTTEINEALKLKIAADLKQGMQQERWFLDPYLTLKKLATYLDAHPNYLSRTINECFEQTFFEYVNGLRIQHCKSRMIEDPLGNTLELAMESGFNSMSSFYTAFKKHLGCNPRDFKKQFPGKTEPEL